MKKIIVMAICAILAAALVCGCAQQPAPSPSQPTGGETISYIDVNVSDAKMMIDSEPALVVVDVSPVWTAGHVQGAISIPLATIGSEIKNLDKGREYLVYCHSDAASISGANTFILSGFSPVYRLAGNYAAWTAAGYPTETPNRLGVTAEKAKELMDTDPYLVVVDVSDQYGIGHLPGATSVPINDLDDRITTMDKSKHYLIYSRDTTSSQAGTDKFVSSGFNPVFRLTGNYIGWVEGGYQVEK